MGTRSGVHVINDVSNHQHVGYKGCQDIFIEYFCFVICDYIIATQIYNNSFRMNH